MNHSPIFPASELFLRTVLRGYFHAAALPEARAQTGQPGFAWPAILAAAMAEGVAPFLHLLLREQEWTPATVQESLRQAYIDTALRNALLLDELGRVLRLLAQAGIPAIILKGAALAEAVYGNAALRPMLDLDLLIPAERVAEAVALLEEIGYQSAGVEVAAGVTLAYENEVMLGKNDCTGTALELHWSLIDSPHYQRTLAMAWFWQTGQPAMVAGAPARVLGLEAQVLHLCAHLLLHHRGRGLLWQMDIVALLHAWGGRIDWDLVLAQAAAFDLVLPLRQVLAELAATWHAPVPALVLHRLAALSPSPAEQQVVQRLTAAQRPTARRFWADLASLPTWQQRLRFAGLHLFPSPAYMRQRYTLSHAALLPAYYLYRWVSGFFDIVFVNKNEKAAKVINIDN